jgi:peptidoglycan hydrolase-like protein with peptidoglycan-binding domain
MLTQGSRGNDVAKLQGDLNKAYPRDMPQLKPDGVFGPKTREWVIKFQRNNPPLKPDGVVGPKTLARLASIASVPGAPPPVGGITIPPGPPATGINKFQAEMRQEFEKKGAAGTFGEFLNDLESNTIPGWKIFLGAIGRVEDARTVANFYLALRQLGLSGSQLSTVLGATMRVNKDALAFFEAVSAPAGKFGSALKFAGSAANVAGLIVTATECIQHARREDYGAVAAEIYKFAMGKAVPWAAMIEGIGSLLDGVVPEQTRKNSYAFRIMRSIDPIGLGASAVDSVCTIVKGGVEMFVKKNPNESKLDTLSRNLAPLAARMKQGPTSVFAELGENSGDALYELTQTDIDVNAMLRYSWMELTEWFENAGSSGPPVGGVRRGTI